MTSVIQDNLHSYHSNYDPNFLSDDEEEYCPLCIEPLDITDKNFFPCPCGYQICQFCYNNIRQNPDLNGRCPACRRKYDNESVRYVVLSQEELDMANAKKARKEKEKKQREKEKKDNDFNSRKHLAGMRVIQKNLVYVVGINPPVPFEEVGSTLRSDKYFGQYGKINKIVVNKKNSHGNNNDNYHSNNNHHSPGYGVYITFASKDDASKCIAQVDGTYMDGKLIKAAYGTTKYCSSYLRGLACPNPNCMFLHEPGEEADSFNRRELHNKQQAQLQQQQQAQQAQQQQQLQHGTQSPITTNHNLFKSTGTSTSTTTSTTTAINNNNNNNNNNGSLTNSPLSVKTHLHGIDGSNSTGTSTPVLTPAHVPVGANPWGVSQTTTPITNLNISKTISSNHLPTLGDSLHNVSNEQGDNNANANANVSVSGNVHDTTTHSSIHMNVSNSMGPHNNNNNSNHTPNKKKSNNVPEKTYLDPYDARDSAIRFLDSRIAILSHYESHEIKLKPDLVTDDEYSQYPSLFSWDNIKASKKSDNVLRDKLIDILATKPIDYSASVVTFLQSVSNNGSMMSMNENQSPLMASGEDNSNGGGNNELNPQNATLPPPGIFPMGQGQQTQPTQSPQIGDITPSTNSTDLLNQLIKGRKVAAGN